MARRIGTLPLQENIETEKQMPLDARQLVRSKEEMLTEGSFTYGYKGLFTAERTEGKIWMLMDNANPTQESSWKVIGPYDDSALDARVTALEQGGGSESGPVDWSDVQNKPSFASVATSGSYNDLADRPVLPAPYDDSALSGRVSVLENAEDKDTLTTVESTSIGIKVVDDGENGNHVYKITGTSVSKHFDASGLSIKFTNGNSDNIILSGGNNVLFSEEESSSSSDVHVKINVVPAVTVDAAMSDTSENPVQNKVVLAAIGDAIDVVETAIADRYTKAETDGKIAEAMVDVDNEHFHPVTALPDPSVAKENHEYVLITYAQDGTTIESETHYLFYNGVFHEKQTQVSLDGYATEAYVGQQLATLATVATSGSYNDLSDKPTIPEAYDDTALAGRVTAIETALNLTALTDQEIAALVPA